MKKFLIFCMLFLLAGCGKNGFFPSHGEAISKQKAVNEVNRRALYLIKKKYGLRPFGTAAQMMGKIKMLGLSFRYNQPIQLKEARELLINAASELVREINSHEEIRPYLAHYPFTLKDVYFSIYVFSLDGRSPPSGSLAVVKLDEGSLVYKVHPEENSIILVEILEESLEEALAEVEKQEHQAV